MPNVAHVEDLIIALAQISLDSKLSFIRKILCNCQPDLMGFIVFTSSLQPHLLSALCFALYNHPHWSVYHHIFTFHLQQPNSRLKPFIVLLTRPKALGDFYTLAEVQSILIDQQEIETVLAQASSPKLGWQSIPPITHVVSNLQACQQWLESILKLHHIGPWLFQPVTYPAFHPLLPQFPISPVEVPWIHPPIINLSLEFDHSNCHELDTLNAAACDTISPDQALQFELDLTCGMYVSPPQFRNIIIFNPNLTSHILQSVSARYANLEPYYAVLNERCTKPDTLELVSGLLSQGIIEVDYMHEFLSCCIVSCGSDRRTARLICCFLHKLFTQSALDLGAFKYQVPQFCLLFANLPDAIALYQLFASRGTIG